MFYIAAAFKNIMTKRGVEKKLVVLLFVLVFVVFSFAERDSKKLHRLYSTAQLLKKGVPVDLASGPANKKGSGN
jgi:hypothetical protein